MVLPSGLGGLGMSAAFAAVLAGWEQVKGLIQRIIGIAIITVDVHGRLYDPSKIYCLSKLKRSPSSFYQFVGMTTFIRPLKRFGPVAYEEISTKGALFWKGWRPLSISPSPGDVMTFRFIRGTFQPRKLVAEIARFAMDCEQKEENGIIHNRFQVIRLSGMSGKDLLQSNAPRNGSSKSAEQGDTPSIMTPSSTPTVSTLHSIVAGWEASELGDPTPVGNPLDRLALSDDIQDMIREVQRWFDSKGWYLERQIPWRRGYLLHGQPGTGKSSLVKALAQHLRIPVYLFDISTMDNKEFHDNFQRAMSNTPAVALIEDVDAVFHGRENLVSEKGQGLTYDCLLNTISGVESTDGLLLIVTTNNLEFVDPALGIPQGGSVSSRPGRIDRAIEMSTLDRRGRLKLATRIMASCHESWIPYLVAKGENDTGAQFEDRCATVALSLFWADDPYQHAPINGYHHEDGSQTIRVAYEGHWATDEQTHFKVEANQP